MKPRSIVALLALLTLLQSSTLASSVSKTFKATPEQVLAATEKALRKNSRLFSVEPIRPELKIQFRGLSLSSREQYSALSGEASVSQSITGACLLTVSVHNVRVSSASDCSQSMSLVAAQASEKSFADSILRQVRHILGQ